MARIPAAAAAHRCCCVSIEAAAACFAVNSCRTWWYPSAARATPWCPHPLLLALIGLQAQGRHTTRVMCWRGMAWCGGVQCPRDGTEWIGLGLRGQWWCIGFGGWGRVGASTVHLLRVLSLMMIVGDCLPVVTGNMHNTDTPQTFLPPLGFCLVFWCASRLW